MQKYKIIWYIIIGLLLIIFSLGIALHHFISKSDRNNDYKNLYESTYKQSEVWKDESGKWRSRAESIEITNNELRNVKDLENIHEEYKDIKKSLKNLQEYNKIGTTTIINNTTHIRDTLFIHGKDTSKALTFSYKNKFEKISGVIVADSINWTIEHKDSLEVVQYWDRTWFLGKKKYFTEIKSLNPNTKIDYQKSIKSKRKKGLF